MNLIQVSFCIIIGPPGRAHDLSIYFSPLLWRWGKVEYQEQHIPTSAGNVFTVARIGWMVGPFAVYAGRR